MDSLIDRFWDAPSNTFLDREKNQENLILPPRMWYDHPTPSGTSTAIEVLFRLSYMSHVPSCGEIASAALSHKGSFIVKYPQLWGQYLTCIQWALTSPVEISLSGDPASSDLRELHKTAYNAFIPQKVLIYTFPNLSSSQSIQIKKGPTIHKPEDTQATASVCYRGSCLKPVHSAEELTLLLKRVQESFSPNHFV